MSANREPKCVIISAGSFVPVDIPLYEGDYCIACDAGFRYAQEMGILPDLIVGDFDSAAEQDPMLMRSIEEIAANDPNRIVRLNVVKDDTDIVGLMSNFLDVGVKIMIHLVE